MDKIEKITPDDACSKSQNLLADNIKQLLALFPEVSTEGEVDGKPQNKIDFDALKEVLGEYVEDKEERYNFTWHGKANARRLAQTPSAGTLRPCKEESVDWDTTQNLFIEGDNLEVLKLLQKSYHKKVKMIYIDPPYNTGKEFIYPDKYKDNLDTYLRYTGQINDEGFKISANTETTGRYHTNWLNMMYPRLKLARNLLRNDGAIFVSIDDNELGNLRRILDDIFGEDNFIGMISRSTGTRMGSGSRGIARELDYILVYSKTFEYELARLPMTEQEASIYNEEDEKGKYLLRSLRRTGGENRREDRPSMFYPVTSPDGDEIYPIAPEGWESRWVCGKDTYERLLSEGEVVWKKVKKSGELKWQVYQKTYLSIDGRESSDLWTKEDGNKKATRELNNLFDKVKIFDHPKSVGVMKKILLLGSKNTDYPIVLDFFAGSASLGHAVYELNVNDGSQRRFILVQLPEILLEDTQGKKLGFDTIADIGKERIRRAVNKIKQENPDCQGDLGFKVFKLDATNIIPWEADFDNLESILANSVDNIKPDRTAEDVLYEILLKYGLDLTLPIKQHIIANKTVFDVGMGALLVCLDDDIPLEVAEGIGKLKEKLQPEVMRVVFKDAGFADDVVKTNTLQVLKQFDIDDVKSI